jgi:oxalate decarboxylase/phosphoglucose isomerase-like protein (cupin superfamily)
LASEWLYVIKGSARMTVFDTGPAAVTADFHAGDIGYVKKALGHYVENTGNTDLVYTEVFRADRFEEVSLSNWLAHSPVDMVAETLKPRSVRYSPVSQEPARPRSGLIEVKKERASHACRSCRPCARARRNSLKGLAHA